MSEGRILVTGATGFIGANLVRTLIADGVEPARLRVLVRPGSPRQWLLEGMPVERAPGSLDDAVALERALAGCELVYHAAAFLGIHTSHRRRFLRTNVAGTQRLLAIAREVGVRRVVVFSSIAGTALGTRAQPATEETPFDLGRFRLPYVDTKRAAEVAALAENGRGLEVVVVNPAFVFGPGDVKPVTGLILLSVAKELYLFTPPGGLSTVDVRDVCRGAILAAARGVPGERYILAERHIGFFELTRMAAALCGARAPLARLPAPLLGMAGLAADFFGHLGAALPFNSSVARYCSVHHCTSGAKAARELGLTYRPLEDTLRDSFAWFEEHGYLKRSGLRLLADASRAGV